MAACFFGSVRHALAVLALAAGDRAAARNHAQAELALHDRLGWPRWSELSRHVLLEATD
jgi:hypothetical protein